ncbi:hypothetical protein CFC21_010290 [Triticum aestivum]|uniref:Cathepsin propeptide inhibitor domain-containing protein n=2 Tax=Triticum aestivum TaxID=4565 RepID=A0A9R1IUM4_WHEAT|nr:uncharacterized protein LOC123164717 [Triticum aestivum]KAF6993392.1 hypothetical protein CFC21_010290 [Triticum aestivum]
MARAQLSFVPITLLLLASLAAAAAAAAAADTEEGDLRISVQYATEEESRWLDRWAEKYKAQGSGEGFKVQPATDEESARMNSMFTGVGYDGHIEFDDDHPFGRMVVDAFHSRPRPSKPNENDDLQKKNLEESNSRAEHDVKDL